MKALKEGVECEHDWVIVRHIAIAEWSEISNIDDNNLIKCPITHTLFCRNCYRIKQID